MVQKNNRYLQFIFEIMVKKFTLVTFSALKDWHSMLRMSINLTIFFL